MDQAEKRLRSLDSQSGQQEARLEGLSQESLQAYRWLLDHQDEFEKEVFGPPVVTCSVKDKRYTDALETLIQTNDLAVFTAQTRNDFRKLQTILCGQMKLGDINITTCSVPLDTFRPPWTNDELMDHGFDGWALDYLAGPAPVLAMLASEYNLYKTPVALREISEGQFQRLADTPTITNWVSGKRSYKITRRREYGPDAHSTSVKDVWQARFWTVGSADISAKNKLQSNIQEWRQEMQEYADNDDSDKKLLGRLHAERDEVEKERVRTGGGRKVELTCANSYVQISVETEKSNKQRAFVSYRAIPEKISTFLLARAECN